MKWFAGKGSKSGKGGRPPRGGRGLKFFRFRAIVCMMVSPPSRGAWIEMIKAKARRIGKNVAPLAGGVD